MATDRQTEANRLNALKSTGPRSAEGKARSRLNALQTGIDAESILLPGEDPAAVETLRAEYYQHHQPVTPDERDTLDAVIHAVCLMRRFRVLEAQLTKHEMDYIQNLDQSAPLGHVFSNASLKFVYLQSRMNSVERSFHRNQDRLERLKSLRPPLEDPPPAESAEPQLEELASNSHHNHNPQPLIPNPQLPPHPARYQDCPHCSRMGFFGRHCPYLHKARQATPPPGEPLPGHPALLDDCPICRNIGYIHPHCQYVRKEPQI